jgi:hypothetical protein
MSYEILDPFSLSPFFKETVLQEILSILRGKLIAFSLMKEDVDSSLVTQMLWGHTTHIGRTLDLTLLPLPPPHVTIHRLENTHRLEIHIFAHAFSGGGIFSSLLRVWVFARPLLLYPPSPLELRHPLLSKISNR